MAIARSAEAAVFVSEKFAAVTTPATVAVTVYGPPAVPLAVNVAEVATPLAFVTAVFTPPAKLPLAPVPGAVNVTVTPETGFPPLSFTVATSGAAKAVLMVALCGVPLVAVMLAGVPAVLVSKKFAAVTTPATVAVTVYGPPAVPLAVNVAEVATPLAFVTAVFTPPAKLPLAPLPGAVNVTVTPETGFPPLSFTVATSGAANVVLMVVLCGVPLVAVMLAGVPAVFVSKKFAAVTTPATVAVTVYGPPGVPLAVNVAEVATPLAFVTAVFTPPAKLPLAPVPGAVNVTVTPETGLPPASFTVATSGAAKAVLMVAICGVPLVAVIDAAAAVPTLSTTELA